MTSSNNNNNNNKIPFYGLPRPPPAAAPSSSVKQRLVVALKSASAAFRDPMRDDAVAALGEVTGRIALQRLLRQLRQHPTGRLILRDKPLVSKATIPYDSFLQQAKTIQQQQQKNQNNQSTNDNNSDNDNNITFGQAYGLFLLEHGFDPDERKEVQHIPNNTSVGKIDNNTTSNNDDFEDIAYIMMRYRQCHDYWHTLTGLPPTVLGELGLKWLELFQTGLPIAALSGTVGSLGLQSYKEQEILYNLYIPWAIRVHKQQQLLDPNGSLLTVYYEKEFDTSLHELRKRLGINPAPTSTYT